MLEGVEDRGRILDRIESRAGDRKDEEWLQALIHARPEILPVSDFDEGIGQLIPLGREIATNAGPLDLLFATSQGQLIVVETKLWKNPEKHRVVVAQVIDYAKELASWSYDDLDTAVLASSRNLQESPARSIRDRFTQYFANQERDFHEFQENLIASLNHGRFLLLIVGDRISPNVAMLSAAIHGAPGLEFQFGLVELQMHPIQIGQDWPLLIVPEIVGRTVEETRAVVRIQYQGARPTVDVVVSAEGKAKDSEEKVSLASLRDQLPEDMQPAFERWSEYWREKGFTFNYGTWGIGFYAPVEGIPRSIFEVYPDSITLRTDKKHKSIDPDPKLHQEYLDDLAEAPMARERLAAGRRTVQFKTIGGDEFELICRANVRFAEKITS